MSLTPKTWKSAFLLFFAISTANAGYSLSIRVRLTYAKPFLIIEAQPANEEVIAGPETRSYFDHLPESLHMKGEGDLSIVGVAQLNDEQIGTQDFVPKFQPGQLKQYMDQLAKTIKKPTDNEILWFPDWNNNLQMTQTPLGYFEVKPAENLLAFKRSIQYQVMLYHPSEGDCNFFVGIDKKGNPTFGCDGRGDKFDIKKIHVMITGNKDWRFYTKYVNLMAKALPSVGSFKVTLRDYNGNFI